MKSVNTYDEIKKIIEEKLHCCVQNVSVIGSGASGSVYKVSVNKCPYELAVKVSCHKDMLERQYKEIKFISDRVDCRLPKLYFICFKNNKAYLGMELIRGVEPCAGALLFRPHKKKLADDIVDNLIKIHMVKGGKFGPVGNAVYDTWLDYYSEFAKEIYDFSFADSAVLPKIVKNAVSTAYNNLYKIIGDYDNTPTLTHGDYWLPNFIIDAKAMKLNGIIDPFNVMWSEPEYELFTLTVGYGKNLKLYENYKDKITVTKNCDMKLELYALFNELLWYKKTGKIGFSYLKYRSKNLLKRFNSAT